jgi:hypothetical protein
MHFNKIHQIISLKTPIFFIIDCQNYPYFNGIIKNILIYFILLERVI